LIKDLTFVANLIIPKLLSSVYRLIVVSLSKEVEVFQSYPKSILESVIVIAMIRIVILLR